MSWLQGVADVLQPVGVIVGFIGTVLGLPYALWKARAWFLALIGAAEAAKHEATTAASKATAAAQEATQAAASSRTTAAAVDTATETAARQHEQVDGSVMYLARELAAANATVDGLRTQFDDLYTRLIVAKTVEHHDHDLAARMRRVEDHLADTETRSSR